MRLCIPVVIYRKVSNFESNSQHPGLTVRSGRVVIYRKVSNFESNSQQDWGNIPTSMCGESWLSDEIWKVINALRPLPQERINAFYEYCENNGLEQDFAAFQEFDKKNIKRTKKMPYIAEYTAELQKAKEGDWVDYYLKRTSHIAMLDGHLVAFEKPEIETRFCFGYSDCGQGQSYAECQEEHRNFGATQFLRENLSSFDDTLDYFKPENEQSDKYHWHGRSLYLLQQWKNANIFKAHFLPDYEVQNQPWRWVNGDMQIVKASAEAVEQYHQALIEERQKFEKRLNSYLKRYGTSKLHTWTYWMDE